MNYIQKVIVHTLIYSDIFDYPLTKEELWKYAVGVKNLLPLQKNDFLTELQKPSSVYIYYQGFYVLKDRKRLISLRLTRQHIGHKKLSTGKRVTKLLSLIPTVRFIGVTGTLSMLNTDEEDDIDFFIITQHNTIWISRLLMLAVLECIGKRRKRGETRAQDKICVNLMIDEAALALPEIFRDIYTAHEVVQIQPLFDRNNTYAKFLHENVWVTNFLPNALSQLKEARGAKREFVIFLFSCFLSLFNSIAKRLELWYMKKQSTSEIITDTILAFYEGNTRRKVLREYEKKLKQYEI